MFCKNCGNQINDGATFCKYCGTSLARPAATVSEATDTPVCPSCGKQVNVGATFCKYCGTSLSAAPSVAPPSPPPTPKPPMPPELPTPEPPSPPVPEPPPTDDAETQDEPLIPAEESPSQETAETVKTSGNKRWIIAVAAIIGVIVIGFGIYYFALCKSPANDTITATDQVENVEETPQSAIREQAIREAQSGKVSDNTIYGIVAASIGTNAVANARVSKVRFNGARQIYAVTINNEWIAKITIENGTVEVERVVEGNGMKATCNIRLTDMVGGTTSSAVEETEDWISGFWRWAYEDEYVSGHFNLRLNLSNGKVTGGYNASSGMHADGDIDEQSIEGSIKGNVATVTFTPLECEPGIAEIRKVSDNKIEWKIIKDANGNHYVHDEVVLTRQTLPSGKATTPQPQANAKSQEIKPQEVKPPANTEPLAIQQEEEEEDENFVFVTVEKMPEFPGGEAALLKWISDHVNYPTIAAENGIQGRVSCSFVVNADGTVQDVEVARSVDPNLDKEAIRVLKMLPKFKPGEHRGKPVRVKYSVPVRFKLQQ